MGVEYIQKQEKADFEVKQESVRREFEMLERKEKEDGAMHVGFVEKGGF